MNTKTQITLKQLSCLVAVAETQHFRKAAERCGIAQPSLSAQIQNLETALKLRLVERGRSGVALTAAGREVLSRAQSVLTDTQGIIDYAASAMGGLAGTIRLGASPTVAPYLLPYIVATLHRQYKDLSLYVREGGARHLETELSEGVHDIILTQLPSHIADHEIIPLFREPLYLALAVDHPLAEQDEITVEHLAGLKVLSLSHGYYFHDQIEALCETYGAQLVRDYEGTSLDALRVMVGMDMGVTFLPALYAHSEIRARSEVVVKKLRGRAIYRTIGLVKRKKSGAMPGHLQLAEIIRDVAGKRFSDISILT